MTSTARSRSCFAGSLALCARIELLASGCGIEEYFKVMSQLQRAVHAGAVSGLTERRGPSTVMSTSVQCGPVCDTAGFEKAVML